MEKHPEWFPIMGGRPIPWELIAVCERQAQTNHDQSLAQLAKRGGLDASEALAVLEGRRWIRMEPEEADKRLAAILDDHAAKALRELAEAREALGLGWLTGGVSLAEGIRRKTAALEQERICLNCGRDPSRRP